MVLRVCQVEHLASGGCQPDDALADPQARASYSLRIEAPRRPQLQNFACAQAVDGADLSFEFGRDQRHDFRQQHAAAGHHGPQAHQKSPCRG